MNLLLTLILFFALPNEAEASGRVRRVSVQTDQIVTVQTALGIATIIQVPDRPNSLVVGDTESFKVEYLDQAITIKPLLPGAKSNLYIYTDYRRFNVQLVAGPEVSADYVVYLESPKEKIVLKQEKPSLIWTNVHNRLTSETLSLEIKRVGRTKDNILIVEFLMRGKKKEKIDPEWFWITQGGETKPIHRLVFSKLEAAPNSNVDGVIQILKSDLDSSVPIRLELRRKRIAFLTLPEVKKWK
ncbi:MAG: TrbG/VirB9 family P-type conjugative transfer protein [Pseudobdellovibrionaceae bacterium]